MEDYFDQETEVGDFADESDLSKEAEPRSGSARIFIWILVLALIAILLFAWRSFAAPPAGFPSESYLHIESGESLKAISFDAENLHLVQSGQALEFLIELFGNTRHLVTGDYYFKSPISVLAVAEQISLGNFNIAQIKITIPEGMTRAQMAPLFAASLPQFSSADFLSKTANDEGFLFPDTYFFSPISTADDVIARLQADYEFHLAPLRADIAKSGMSEQDVITLASIIEKEAQGADDRAIIAGILEKRFSIGMALQADATVAYALDKTNEELAPGDLKFQTPYNTYLHTGLPPTPIDSPGLAAILAVLHPTVTPYLYYLHDSSGVAHYAATYAEHQENIAKYLK